MKSKNNEKAKVENEINKVEKALSDKIEKAYVEPASKAARHFIGRMVNIFTTDNKDPVEKRMDEALNAFCEAFCSGWRMMLLTSIQDGSLDELISALGYVKKEDLAK